MFTELSTTGLIAARGADAAAFLHSQVTSDIAGLQEPRTQYSGYCTPKGRLLATFLLWKVGDAVLLQLPLALREPIQTRLAKYVLRSKVMLTDVTAEYRLFGVSPEAARALPPFVDALPEQVHDVSVGGAGVCVTRLPLERYLVLARVADAPAVHAALAATARQAAPEAWTRLDIDAAIPEIGLATQEQFTPQMVNLDAIGGVSYTKGCYPGQEVVARTHYLGRLKQRMYPVRIAAARAGAAEPLFSDVFGEQASGTLVSAVSEGDAHCRALAVVQRAAADRPLHWSAPDGPPVTLLPLPYDLPE
jgi:folate-binding protein YgfZ